MTRADLKCQRCDGVGHVTDRYYCVSDCDACGGFGYDMDAIAERLERAEKEVARLRVENELMRDILGARQGVLE